MTVENGRCAPKENDILSILVATDNHLGYMEKDPIRGADSFEAFNEILQLANERNVDMVLLGGDLFHDNRPSHNSLVRCMESLRTHCWGSRPCSLELLSDPAETFMTKFSMVNYMDPNVNVNIPVFSIHGNHDDPSGEGNYASLDMLAVAGLVNYFGKQENADDVAIKPVLLRKGKTHLAMYGLGNIRDERLHRTFLTRKVKMMRPSESTSSWFNLMVLHQNRVQHGAKNYIPENFLESFIDLVVWGHEHECLIDPILNPDRNFHVSQPGSSVATALSEGEAVPKHVGILNICGRKFQMEKIRLRSVRPFVMDEVVLSRVVGLRPTDQRAVNEYLSEKVHEMIEKANEEWLELNSSNTTGVQQRQDVTPPKPLIRLKVEYSGGFNVFNPQRFGQQFVDLAANPRDLLVFYRKRSTLNPELRRRKRADADELAALTASLPDQLQSLHVADLVDEYLEAQNLNLLPENELGAAVKDYVDKDLRDAIKCFVDDSLKRTRQEIQPTQLVGEEECENVALQRNILHAKEKRRQEYEQLPEAVKNKGKGKAGAREGDDDGASLIDDDDSFGEEEQPKPSRGGTANKRTTTRGRGRGAATAARRRTKATPSRNRRNVVDSGEEDIMDDDMIEEEEPLGSPPEVEEPSSSRKRKAPAPKTAPTLKRLAASSTNRRGRGRGNSATGAVSPRQSQLAFAPASTSKSKPSTMAPPSRATLAFRAPAAMPNNNGDNENEDDDDTFEDFSADASQQRSTMAPGRRVGSRLG